MWTYIIEDDAHCLVAVANLMREMGIHFKRNTTGARVLEHLHAMPVVPSFILLDLDLPQGDALQLCKALHDDARFAYVPVIGMGDPSTFGLLPALEGAGFSAFIPKPLPRRDFSGIIERVLDGDKVFLAGV